MAISYAKAMSLISHSRMPIPRSSCKVSKNCCLVVVMIVLSVFRISGIAFLLQRTAKYLPLVGVLEEVLQGCEETLFSFRHRLTISHDNVNINLQIKAYARYIKGIRSLKE